MEIVGPDKPEEPREESALSEVLNHAMPTAVVAVDARQQITTCSPEAEALIRLEAGQLLHQPLTRLPPALQDTIRETLVSGQAVRNREITLNGETVPRTLRVSTTPVCNGGQEIHGVIAVMDDITRTRHFAGKMRQLDRLASIGTLSASMGHEIKNALVPIRTFVGLLLHSNKDAELADLVSRELRRVESIVSQMLKFAGPARPTFAAIRMHELLEQALQLVRHQLNGRKLRLVRAFQASRDVVRGDTYQLEQALLNLFFNAIEAMGPNGTLSVATEVLPAAEAEPRPAGGPQAAQLQVAVTDTGTGMLPEQVERLFQPFFTTKPDGTGLGLTITRRIIHEHQGTIRVDTRPNEGTTFRILLPLMARAAEAPAHAG
ncbi:MAG: PAS domain-containing protein [Verrucomicrobia bacterium]|nr:PAS domain-containing protein [Verrucomicrobiota bacterium]